MCLCNENHINGTKRPIIGIMTQEFQPRERNPEFSSFINADYVKAVESSGARVVPILINKTEQYYRDTLHKINGVVVPGGLADFLEKGGLGPSTELVISIAKELNDQKEHFPILGVCWGFEFFLYLTNEKRGMMKQCNCKHMSLSLKMKTLPSQHEIFHFHDFFNKKRQSVVEYDYNSRFLNRLPLTTLLDFQQPITYNNHKWCITEKNFSANKLQKHWRVLTLSTNPAQSKLHPKDRLTFISSIESKRYPFIGVQFHPESAMFNWKGPEVEHSRAAVSAARAFYDWLVEEATLSHHAYPSPKHEFESLIWQYPLHFVKPKPRAMPVQQRFLFD